MTFGKLGKREKKTDPSIKMLAAYTQSMKLLAPAPVAIDYYKQITAWPMMANDLYGDCTCAALGHAIQDWTSLVGTPRILTDDQVLAVYSAVTGFNKADPSTDQGAHITDILRYWLNSGASGDFLTAYAALPGDMNEIRTAIAWFGVVYVGLALPLSAQTQDIWDVPPGGMTGPGAPGSWGGHAVPLVGYKENGNFVCVTWGGLKEITPAFLFRYMDEAYALVSRDFIAANGTAPSGLNLTQMELDLANFNWNNRADATTVGYLYDLLLDRDADPVGLQGWTNAVTSAVALGIVTGGEFHAKHPVADQHSLTLLYNLLMGRAPDQAGLAYYNGAPIAPVISCFLASPEYTSQH